MLRLGLFDLRVGYVLSAVLAVVFISLGANLLKPRGLTPDGVDVALTLSKLYTEVLGDWMFPVFMLAAFAAMFSTAYSVMDGFPADLLAAPSRALSGERQPEKAVRPRLLDLHGRHLRLRRRGQPALAQPGSSWFSSSAS